MSGTGLVFNIQRINCNVQSKAVDHEMKRVLSVKILECP